VTQAYSTSASFVPALTATVLSYLDPQPSDKVLDLGCGDGVFTANFSNKVQKVLGLDASGRMIEAAQKDHSGHNTEFRVLDVRYLEEALEKGVVEGRGTWDRV
jgi:tRNA/tmRNA/rRNA uracil-C5-methylase (TrmA/RlmC/RlmD family)